jgi:hypothetical protein
MIRILLSLLIISGAAMAAPKDARFPSPVQQAQPKSELDSFFDDDEGRALQQYADKVRRGEMDFDAAVSEFRQKFYGGKPPDYEGFIRDIEGGRNQNPQPLLKAPY